MKKAYIIVLFLGALEGLIHNMGHPVTPAFVKSLGIQDYMFGVFFASMSFGLMIGSPIFGFLGDKFPKNRLMFLGLLVYSLGQIGFGLSTNSFVMIIFRVVSGLGVSGIMTLLVSYTIEISDQTRRSRNLALLAATIALFASIGYKFGGFLFESTFFHHYLHTELYSTIFVIQGVLNAGFAFLVLLLIHEPKNATSDYSHVHWTQSFKYIKTLDKSLLLFLIAVAFISVGTTNLSKYIDVYFNELSYSPSELGTFVMVSGFVSVLTSAFLVPVMSKLKIDFKLMMLFQLMSAMIVFISFHAYPFIIMMYSVYMIYVIIKAIYIPFEQNFISEYGKEGHMGMIMGIRQAFLSIGMIAGPVIGGLLYEVQPKLVFDFAAAMFLVGFVLFFVISRRVKHYI